jgi:Peptidase_C39 like family/Tetratricopeptide repeat
MRFRVRTAGAAGGLILWALAGCATPQTDRLLEAPTALPPRAEVSGVPFFAQDRYYCGPAALAMVLSWSGPPVTQEEIAVQVYTPGREGTLQSDMVAGARRHGRLAVPVTGLSDLTAELAAGHPVVVFQNLGFGWYPVWHYAVAIGYDLSTGDLILHSGLDARRALPLATFERTWARTDHWGLVVLPPEQLPASADVMAVLRAATALEQAGRTREAATAYAAIAERWPASLEAWIGLGNAAYAAGDLEAAENAFRTATERHPDAGAAWNNLAHVLGEKGRRRDAIAAAERAVRLGGSDAATYRATLREVSGT